ncbi:hypothetical protein PL321_10585 [Caloramator sp. mosi_1]|uniref:hypothetical protein n=1 Tax=Caloramator sp. mosi_1 TaxID=3023090 RepID=UPI002361D285|nr:hypothetical protein [Caloramator sp. mosi_1]WDC83237.1 hypothetical protein PL321_10585 [Caloramator sp. mosi_1]
MNLLNLQYPSENVEFKQNDKLVYSFIIEDKNNLSGGYTATLYLDYNRDTLYRDDEKAIEKINLKRAN